MMEVRIVEEPKKVEKVEVPFVVGGVYRSSTDTYYILAKNKENDDLFHLVSTSTHWVHEALTREAMMKRWLSHFEYIPGAYLAIPKESDN